MTMTEFSSWISWPDSVHQHKGNLHSHTVNSDGHLTPREAVQLYRTHGYSFLAFTDHETFTDFSEDLSSDDFLVLGGIESSARLYDSIEHHHVCSTHHLNGILGTQAMQDHAPLHFQTQEFLEPVIAEGSWNSLEAAQTVCDRLRDHGCMVTYNHPIWSRVRLQDFESLQGISAVEIYNYDTVMECGCGYDTVHWDEMLREGMHINAFASDDNHNNGKFEDSCGGWVSVCTDHLSHDAIIHALLDGQYYSSSGPVIDQWSIKDGIVYVSCSPCERISFICGGPVGTGSSVTALNHQPLCSTSYQLSGAETYIRIECTDSSGRTAWTNARFCDEA